MFRCKSTPTTRIDQSTEQRNFIFCPGNDTIVQHDRVTKGRKYQLTSQTINLIRSDIFNRRGNMFQCERPITTQVDQSAEQWISTLRPGNDTIAQHDRVTRGHTCQHIFNDLPNPS